MQGVPFALTLKGGSWRLLDEQQATIDSCTVHQRLDGKLVKYLAIPKDASQQPIVVSQILVLRRRRKATPIIEPIEPTRALSELISGAFTPSQGLTVSQFKCLATMISAASPAELSYSRLEDAVLEIAIAFEAA